MSSTDELGLSISDLIKWHYSLLTSPGLTQLAQAMVREAHRALKNYTKDIAISGRFSCPIK